MSVGLVVAAIATGLIVAIVVVGLIIMVLLALRPRLKRRREQSKLESRRGELADRHRSDAENLRLQSDLAAQEAERYRAEAQALEKRAQLHERGLADHEIRGKGIKTQARHREWNGSRSRREGR